MKPTQGNVIKIITIDFTALISVYVNIDATIFYLLMQMFKKKLKVVL